MTTYVPRHFAFLDAGMIIECVMCGATTPLAEQPDQATWEQRVFIDNHTACGGDAA